MNTDIIAFTAIGSVVWLVILYLIIASAVHSGTKHQTYYLRALYRAELLRMKKEGYTQQQLSDLHFDDNDQFWHKLTGDITPKAGE